MRTRLLAAALLIMAALAAAAATETATITIRPGDNWIALPLVPLDPSPQAILPGAAMDYTLTRLDAPSQLPIEYNPSQPDAFGNLLLGDGFLVNNPTSTTFVSTYTGLPDGTPDSTGRMTDVWMSLPGDYQDGQNAGGLHWVGHPFNHSTPFDSLLVIDSSGAVSMESAIALGWIDAIWRGWNSVTQQEFTVSLASYQPNDLYLRAGHMYKVTTYRDDMTVIVPANVIPEPGSLLALLSGLAGASCCAVKRRGKHKARTARVEDE